MMAAKRRREALRNAVEYFVDYSDTNFDTESAMTITGDETPGKESPKLKGNDWSMMAKLQEENDRNLGREQSHSQRLLNLLPAQRDPAR
jgi:hypothetical protein